MAKKNNKLKKPEIELITENNHRIIETMKKLSAIISAPKVINKKSDISKS